jgi:serine/threonine protein phosphatase PrpC
MTSPAAAVSSGSRKAFIRSHVGRVRRHNEDACAVSASDEVVTDWQGELPGRSGWAIVADGLGGHAAGEIASTLAVEILRPLMAGPRDHDDVASAIERADAGLYLAMIKAPATRGMGSTIAGIVLLGNHVLAFNVGDSRIYTLNGDSLAQISTDDVVEGNLLPQCLGGAHAQVAMNPHVVRIPLEPDTVLLLCTDGLTEMLPDVGDC